MLFDQAIYKKVIIIFDADVDSHVGGLNGLEFQKKSEKKKAISCIFFFF